MNRLQVRRIVTYSLTTVFGYGLFGLLVAVAAHAEFKTSCYAKLEGRTLVIGNELVQRTWQLGEGELFAKDLIDKKGGVSWNVDQEAQPNGPLRGEWKLKTDYRSTSVVAAESLNATLTYRTSKDAEKYVFRIFDYVPAIEWSRTTLDREDERADAVVDELRFPSNREIRFIAVQLQDDTDRHNELVHKIEVNPSNTSQSKVSANIAYVEDENQCGILFVKRAPLPHARSTPIDHDFQWLGDRLIWRATVSNNVSGRGYPCATITYRGGRAGRIAAIQDYSRSVRKYDPIRDGLLLSNTWGDRSRDSKISEEFLIKEIEAGARLGVDVMQVDDGWQQGTTQNSALVSRSKQGVWSGFWKNDPKFWMVHKQRLPNGLEPAATAADQAGLTLGLWYAPDSENEFSNFERDAKRILQLYSEYGVRHFKLDSITMTTPQAEVNVRRLLDRISQGSRGEICVDLDVTASVRPGYLGAITAGNVFVENRYTEFKGIGKYWPHATLRNFWSLAEFVDPVRLRMEFLNNTRNTDSYNDSPLAPEAYPPDYLFASVMFGSPLAWMEVSGLPLGYVERVSDLVRIWKEHREAIHRGHIIPIGSQPDGYQWTGLVSVARDRQSCYFVVLRELTEEDRQVFTIPLMRTSDCQVKVLAGQGKAKFDNRELAIHLPDAQSFVFGCIHQNLETSQIR